MSLSDPIGDMLARIKNAQVRNHRIVSLPSSKFKAKIADVLKSEGYIIDYKINDEKKPSIEINLKYNSGNPVINTIERISKPGRRIFSSAESLPKVNNGLGIAIISTPKGVMTDIDARKQKVGGEIICKVF
jgi:small subunit ribosomal protein S8